jgi:ribosomal protein S18 acetylase RimI-like enzyme
MAKQNSIKILKLYVHKNNKNAKKVYERIGMSKKLYDIFQIDL